MWDDSGDKGKLHAVNYMSEGMVAIFESFILREEYDKAMEFLNDCFGLVPTPFVINEIIFKILINCNENLAYTAADFLEGRLIIMSAHEDQKSDFIKALKDQSGTNSNLWDTFSHFVWSSLYSFKVSEAYHSHKDYVKSPNCNLLVDFYIKAFLKCSIKRDILGSRTEERLSSLLKWISLYYKYNLGNEPVLSYLHDLLSYIVESVISNDSSLPSSVKFHTANLSQHMFLILNICKDIFASVENQQRFFIYSMSPYFITKVCQYRLNELLEKKSLPQNPEILTLKSIVDNYFFHHQQKNLIRKSISTQKCSPEKKLKKFSKDPLPGDTDFHEHCRLGRPADLLCSLYGGKTKEINKKNSAGNTPLHEACLSSSYLCCKFLIEESGDRKVNYKATENEGRTPLHCAVYVDALDIVKLLLKRGGDYLIKYQDNWGKKPIDYSVSKEMKKLLQDVESKLEENCDEKSEESSVSTQLKLPNLKSSKHFHLYLRTLRTFVSNYCEIYDLQKTETGVKVLSHESKECYHYKAGNETLCMEDSSTLETFSETIKKFISCAKLVSKDKDAEKEISHWERFATVYK